MTTTFQVGDKVRRVRGVFLESITNGDVHTVRRVTSAGGIRASCQNLWLEGKKGRIFFAENFELVEKAKPSVTVPVMTESEAEKLSYTEGQKMALRGLGIIVPDPVDPALLAAREHFSQFFVGRTHEKTLAGKLDGAQAIKTFLAGVEWARSNHASTN